MIQHPMIPRTYTTEDETIEHEILNVLGEHAPAHDIDAIAKEVITTQGEGTTHFRYVLNSDIDTDTYWEIVQRHQID